MQQELVRRLSGALTKAANEMRAAHPSRPGQIAQSNVAFDIRFHEILASSKDRRSHPAYRVSARWTDGIVMQGEIFRSFDRACGLVHLSNVRRASRPPPLWARFHQHFLDLLVENITNLRLSFERVFICA